MIPRPAGLHAPRLAVAVPTLAVPTLAIPTLAVATLVVATLTIASPVAPAQASEVDFGRSLAAYGYLDLADEVLATIADDAARPLEERDAARFERCGIEALRARRTADVDERIAAFSRAADAYRRFCDQRPDGPRVAEARLEIGWIERTSAWMLLLEADANPDTPSLRSRAIEILDRAAETFAEQGEALGSLEDPGPAMRADFGRLECLVLAGRASGDATRLESAVTLAEEYVFDHEDDLSGYHAWVLHGIALGVLGRPDAAATSFGVVLAHPSEARREALARFGDLQAYATFAAVRALVEADSPDSPTTTTTTTTALLESLLAGHPDQEDGFFGRGAIYHHAIGAEANGDFGESLVRLSDLAEGHDHWARMARRTLDRFMIGGTAPPPRTLLEMARADRRSGRYERAIDRIQTALDAGPEPALAIEAWTLLGRLYGDLGRHQEAGLALETAARRALATGDAVRAVRAALDSHRSFRRSHRATGGADEAVDRTRRFLIDTFPDAPEIEGLAYEAGVDLERQGRLDDAIAQYGRVSERSARHVAARFRIGICHDRADRGPEAVDALRSFLRLGAEIPEGLDERALARRLDRLAVARLVLAGRALEDGAPDDALDLLVADRDGALVEEIVRSGRAPGARVLLGRAWIARATTRLDAGEIDAALADVEATAGLVGDPEFGDDAPGASHVLHALGVLERDLAGAAGRPDLEVAGVRHLARWVGAREDPGFGRAYPVARMILDLDPGTSGAWPTADRIRTAVDLLEVAIADESATGDEALAGEWTLARLLVAEGEVAGALARYASLRTRRPESRTITLELLEVLLAIGTGADRAPGALLELGAAEERRAVAASIEEGGGLAAASLEERLGSARAWAGWVDGRGAARRRAEAEEALAVRRDAVIAEGTRTALDAHVAWLASETSDALDAKYEALARLAGDEGRAPHRVDVFGRLALDLAVDLARGLGDSIPRHRLSEIPGALLGPSGRVDENAVRFPSNPDWWRVRVVLLTAYRHLGESRRKVTVYQNLVQLHLPDDETVLAMRAEVEETGGETDEVREADEEARFRTDHLELLVSTREALDAEAAARDGEPVPGLWGAALTPIDDAPEPPPTDGGGAGTAILIALAGAVLLGAGAYLLARR